MVVNELDPQSRRGETPQMRYPVNIRLTVPFYPRPFFVTLIVGREKRGPERLREERVRHPLDTWGNILAAFSLGVGSSIALIFLMMLMTGFPA